MITITGLILLTSGVYFIYAPLALIVPGILLIVFGIYGAMNGHNQHGDSAS